MSEAGAVPASKGFCTSCGVAQTEGSRFCVGCGTPFKQAATSTAPVPRVTMDAPKPPSTTHRQLRCVRCGSAIDAGLTCAVCSRGEVEPSSPDTKAAVAAPSQPMAAATVAPQRAAARSAQGTTAPSRQAPPKHDAPGGWKNGRLAVGAAWIVAIGVFLVYYNDKTHGALARGVPALQGGVASLTIGLDGQYDVTRGAVTATLTVIGSKVRLTLPGIADLRDVSVERHGDTLKFSGGMEFDADGRLLDATYDPKSLLGSVGDDGQSITIHTQSGDLRFVKR